MILGFAAVAPFAMILLWPYAPLAGVGVVVLSHMLVLYPTLMANVQWLGPVVTRFETAHREVWLTIDDGPTDDTRAVLDLFERHDVKATFFLKGALAERQRDLVAEIVARGHSVGNHTGTHPSASFWCALPGRVASEIDGGSRAIASVVGDAPRWFRAPAGMKNPAVHPALERRGMRLIGWTVRGFDAVVSDADQIVTRVTSNIEPGAIILLHQGREHSVRILERVVLALKERGYSCVIPDDAQLRAA